MAARFCNVKRANTEGCRLARISASPESLARGTRARDVRPGALSRHASVPRVDPAKGVTLILRKLDVFLPFRRGALRMHRVDVREIPGLRIGRDTLKRHPLAIRFRRIGLNTRDVPCFSRF